MLCDNPYRDKMITWYLVAVFMCNLSLLSGGAINYCGTKICGLTNDHTFCMYPYEVPGIHCTGYIASPLTDQEKFEILHRLNTRRNAAASGRLRDFPTAGNMLKLRWVSELEREAQVWANQCVMPSKPEEHDLCRDLYATSVGQCVASVIGEAPGLRPETMVDIWYMQSMNYKGDINAYKISQGNQSYADFAQMLYAKTFMVGCARSKFMAVLQGRLRTVERLVCNFAPQGPVDGRPIWATARPATLCPPRAIQDHEYPALCDFQLYLDESFDQDHAMTLEDHILLETVFTIEKNNSMNYANSLDEIYLTKLAVATLSNDEAENINSVQKRDITTPNNSKGTIIEEPKYFKDKSNSLTVEKASTRAVSAKIYKDAYKGVIGRPKSYSFEELSNVITKEVPVTKNEDRLDSPTNLNYLYLEEYNYEDKNTIDNNSIIGTVKVISSTSKITKITPISSNASAIVISMSDTVSPIQTTITEVNVPVSSNNEATQGDSYIRLFLANMNDSFNDTEQLIDELLADTEMANRIHQEFKRLKGISPIESAEPSIAIDDEINTNETTDTKFDTNNFTLERFARYLQNRAEGKPQIPTNINEENASNIPNDEQNILKNPQHVQENYQNVLENESQDINTESREIRQLLENEPLNITEDIPMLNVVMKYVPFIKNYENGFVNGKSKKSCLSPTFLLVFSSLVSILYL